MGDKHTPGKWDAQEGLMDHYTKERRRCVWGSIWGQGWIVAEVLKNADGNHEANARLIAAAPELLEALRGCLDAMEHMGNVLNDLDLAFDDPELEKHSAAWSVARAAIAKATEEEPAGLGVET